MEDGATEGARAHKALLAVVKVSDVILNTMGNCWRVFGRGMI